MASNPVYVNGYKTGAVTEVKYNTETGVFDVTCSILKKIPVPVDTKRRFTAWTCMGGKGIRLDLGSSDVMVKGRR